MSGVSQALVIEYRSPHRTAECIRNVLSQGVPVVHVVDNSNDEGKTREVLLQTFGADSRVAIFDAGANLGFAAGVNFGLRHRVSDRVLLINNDATLGAGVIPSLEAALDSFEEVCIVFPSLLHDGEVLNKVYYHRWLALLTSRQLSGTFEVPRACCMLVALDRLPSTLLFDERFFMYGEEIALGWYLHKRGLRFLHVGSVWVQHEGSATAVRGSPFYEERTALAHLLLSKVLARRGIQRHFLGGTRFVMLVLRALIRSVRQRSLLPLRALVQAYRLCRGTGSAAPPPI